MPNMTSDPDDPLPAELPDSKESTGPLIRSFRLRMSLTQAALAGRLGVSPLTVWLWENGRVRPSEGNWCALRALAGERGITTPWTSAFRAALKGSGGEAERMARIFAEHVEELFSWITEVAGKAGLGCARAHVLRRPSPRDVLEIRIERAQAIAGSSSKHGAATSIRYLRVGHASRWLHFIPRGAESTLGLGRVTISQTNPMAPVKIPGGGIALVPLSDGSGHAWVWIESDGRPTVFADPQLKMLLEMTFLGSRLEAQRGNR